MILLSNIISTIWPSCHPIPTFYHSKWVRQVTLEFYLSYQLKCECRILHRPLQLGLVKGQFGPAGLGLIGLTRASHPLPLAEPSENSPQFPPFISGNSGFCSLTSSRLVTIFPFYFCSLDSWVLLWVSRVLNSTFFPLFFTHLQQLSGAEDSGIYGDDEEHKGAPRRRRRRWWRRLRQERGRLFPKRSVFLHLR